MNQWEAMTGFILSIVFMAVASLIGWLDPWNTEMPWVNAVAVAVACMFAVGTSFGLIQYAGNNGSWLFRAMSMLVMAYLYLGGYAAAGVAGTTSHDTLVITVYIAYPVAAIFSMMTLLFFGELLNARAQSSRLSRV